MGGMAVAAGGLEREAITKYFSNPEHGLSPESGLPGQFADSAHGMGLHPDAAVGILNRMGEVGFNNFKDPVASFNKAAGDHMKMGNDLKGAGLNQDQAGIAQSFIGQQQDATGVTPSIKSVAGGFSMQPDANNTSELGGAVESFTKLGNQCGHALTSAFKKLKPSFDGGGKHDDDKENAHEQGKDHEPGPGQQLTGPLKKICVDFMMGELMKGGGSGGGGVGEGLEKAIGQLADTVAGTIHSALSAGTQIGDKQQMGQAVEKFGASMAHGAGEGVASGLSHAAEGAGHALSAAMKFRMPGAKG